MEDAHPAPRNGPAALKILLIVLLAAGLVVLALIMARRLMFRWAADKWAENLTVGIAPSALDTGAIDVAKGDSIEAFDFRAETASVGITRPSGEDAPDPKRLAIFVLPDGRRIIVPNPGDAVAIRDTLLASVDDGTHEDMVSLLGRETMASNHSLLRAVMETVPDEVDPVRDGSAGERATILLGLKAVLTVNGESGIFAFSFPGLRGYQMGDPAQAKLVIVTAVDAGDGPVEILFLGTDDGKRFRQAEITRVLSTFARKPE